MRKAETLTVTRRKHKQQHGTLWQQGEVQPVERIGVDKQIGAATHPAARWHGAPEVGAEEGGVHESGHCVIAFLIQM